jgi:DNA-binding cell septation regulator SpoVG
VSGVVEVLELRRVENAGNLKAFAKVRLGCIVIHGCRVIQQPEQKPWVALPQTPARKKADGAGSGWFPAVAITNRNVLDQVRDSVLEAWGRRS